MSVSVTEMVDPISASMTFETSICVLRVLLEDLERHLLPGQRLLEGGFVRELLPDLGELAFDLGVGDGKLADLGLLDQQTVPDELIEHLSVDLVPLLERHALARAGLEVLDRRFEVCLRDGLTVDACQHLGERGGYRLDGGRLSRGSARGGRALASGGRGGGGRSSQLGLSRRGLGRPELRPGPAAVPLADVGALRQARVNSRRDTTNQRVLTSASGIPAWLPSCTSSPDASRTHHRPAYQIADTRATAPNGRCRSARCPIGLAIRGNHGGATGAGVGRVRARGIAVDFPGVTTEGRHAARTM